MRKINLDFSSVDYLQKLPGEGTLEFRYNEMSNGVLRKLMKIENARSEFQLHLVNPSFTFLMNGN